MVQTVSCDDVADRAAMLWYSMVHKLVRLRSLLDASPKMLHVME